MGKATPVVLWLAVLTKIFLSDTEEIVKLPEAFLYVPYVFGYLIVFFNLWQVLGFYLSRYILSKIQLLRKAITKLFSELLLK